MNNIPVVLVVKKDTRQLERWVQSSGVVKAIPHLFHFMVDV